MCVCLYAIATRSHQVEIRLFMEFLRRLAWWILIWCVIHIYIYIYVCCHLTLRPRPRPFPTLTAAEIPLLLPPTRETLLANWCKLILDATDAADAESEAADIRVAATAL